MDHSPLKDLIKLDICLHWERLHCDYVLSGQWTTVSPLEWGLVSVSCTSSDIHQKGGFIWSLLCLCWNSNSFSYFEMYTVPVVYCNLGYSHSQHPTSQPSFKLHHPADTSLQWQEVHVAMRSAVCIPSLVQASTERRLKYLKMTWTGHVCVTI